jgi:cysteine desulfurase/selenocysteine lyase
MSTSDASPPSFPPGDTGGGTDAASVMAKEIERLANTFFSGGPAAMGAPSAVPPLGFSPFSASVPAGSPIPSHVAPSALSVGAGGVSSSMNAPPTPGPLASPPLASSPLPKESDLRAIPTVLGEQLGLGSSLVLVTAPQPSETPYFLNLAGIPGSAVAPSYGAVPTPAHGAPVLSGGLPGSSGVPVQMPDTQAKSAPGVATPTAMPTATSLPPEISSYDFQPELVPELGPSGGLFDANAIKRDFPILQERVHGRPLVWLDNAATTQKPQVVIDRISYFYEHENSNIHRAAHALAARATDAYEGARDKVRRFLNAPSSKEIIFVRGATEGINLIAQSYGRRNVSRGDEIVITWLEHHANIVPWQQLCSEKGARLRVAPVDDRGQVVLEEYEKLLGPRTRIVSITQVSNALGTIVPVRDMVAMAHRHGARVVVDGAQAVSHMPVDVQEIDCDFFSFSGHKVFAPTGIGVVYGKPDVLEAMPPWQGGGNMISDVTFEKTTYQPPPGRFEAGTGNIADAVGLGAALDYVSSIGLENIRRYEHELLEYAERGLAGVPGLRMIGTAAEKAGVLSFVLDGQRTEDVGAALDQEGIAVRSGHHCAQPILRRFGLESTVRASLAPYNTCEDIDALIAALLRLQAGRPRS